MIPKIYAYLCSTLFSYSNMRIKDDQSLILKSEVAHQILPHLKPSVAWEKIRLSLGDDPVLWNAFHSHRHYLYVSEYQYLMRTF